MDANTEMDVTRALQYAGVTLDASEYANVVERVQRTVQSLGEFMELFGDDTEMLLPRDMPAPWALRGETGV